MKHLKAGLRKRAKDLRHIAINLRKHADKSTHMDETKIAAIRKISSKSEIIDEIIRKLNTRDWLSRAERMMVIVHEITSLIHENGLDRQAYMMHQRGTGETLRFPGRIEKGPRKSPR